MFLGVPSNMMTYHLHTVGCAVTNPLPQNGYLAKQNADRHCKGDNFFSSLLRSYILEP